jgi:hypothetical protein
MAQNKKNVVTHQTCQICRVVWQIFTKLTKGPEVILAKTKTTAKLFSLKK